MDFPPLAVSSRPRELKLRFQGAPAAIVAVRSPLTSVPPSSVTVTTPWPLSAPTSSNPWRGRPPRKCSSLTPTMPGRGELSVTVMTGWLRVSPREVMTLVGAVTTRVFSSGQRS